MSTTAREQMVEGAADMLARGGFARASVREVARHSGAPLGSTYHYFSGGKADLAREAVEFAGAATSTELQKALRKGPIDGVRALLSWWRQILINSDFESGCAVLSVAVTESRAGAGAPVVRAAQEVFAEWTQLLRESLVAYGIDESRSDGLATMTVCAVEGSVALCRVEESTRALDSVEATILAMIQDALPNKAPCR